MTALLLESYVAERWYAAPDDGTPIAVAVTGETVVRISSTGLDVAAMLDHARTVGGPALRELTFHSGLACSSS
jgi:oxepin-CoA hydrolase/3-oxo-5,6-dehydrosuberyl-CoA semialdehyde dehydrogenase